MKKTTKATAQKNKKIELVVKQVTVKRVHETYELEYDGYKLFVQLNDNKIVLNNIAGSSEFIFDTVRNPVTKKRWQAVAQLIIEATKLI